MKFPAEISTVYIWIGETGRSLEMRLNQHNIHGKNGDTNNGITVHAWDNDNHVNWDAAKVVAVEHHLIRRKVF